MILRRLVPTDALAYRELMLEAYEQCPDAFTSSHAERAALPPHWWETRLETGSEPSQIVLGAFENARLAGVVGLSFETREKARHKTTLFGMYVPMEFRQRGLGRQLVLAALRHAKDRNGVSVVQLTVTHGNLGAQSLYENCGFVTFGLEPNAIAVGPRFLAKVHMWCDLARAG